MTVSTKELRTRTKEIMEAMKRGEEVIITYRGKPAARIVPIREKEDAGHGETDDSLFGVWKDNPAVEDVGEFIDKVRGGRFG
jgi:prevent-host-death family protein